MSIEPEALAAGAALGDASAAQKKEALHHFVAGKRAAKSKKWDKAVSELRASLEIVNSPNARLVLSRALRDSGLLGDAWGEYGTTAADATKLADKEPQYSQTASAAIKERGEIEGKLASGPHPDAMTTESGGGETGTVDGPQQDGNLQDAGVDSSGSDAPAEGSADASEGGPPPACSPTCPNGNVCGTGGDCASKVCSGGICQPPACAPNCPSGSPCGANTDCAAHKCNPSNTCK